MNQIIEYMREYCNIFAYDNIDVIEFALTSDSNEIAVIKISKHRTSLPGDDIKLGIVVDVYINRDIEIYEAGAIDTFYMDCLDELLSWVEDNIIPACYSCGILIDKVYVKNISDFLIFDEDLKTVVNFLYNENYKLTEHVIDEFASPDHDLANSIYGLWLKNKYDHFIISRVQDQTNVYTMHIYITPIPEIGGYSIITGNCNNPNIGVIAKWKSEDTVIKFIESQLCKFGISYNNNDMINIICASNNKEVII